MKLSSILLLIILSVFTNCLPAQDSPVGIWKTIDDVSGESKSLVEIYEDNGIIYARIIKLLLSDPASICEACKGDKKDQPVLGMLIMESMKKKKDYWAGGTIMDPENGKTYKCKISLEDKDKLKLRGYIGIEALGRNQYWTRVE